MKRKEFIKAMQILGYTVYTTNKATTIRDSEDNYIGSVCELKEKDLCITNLPPKHKGVYAFNYITEYALTPIAEREENLYTLSLPNNVFSKKYLEVNTEDNRKYRIKSYPAKISYTNGLDEVYKCVFTEEEIKDLPNQEFIKTLERLDWSDNN